MGPWYHGIPPPTLVGSHDFGMRSGESLSPLMFDLQAVLLRWYDHWLKGLDNGVAGDAPVRIFVMGENVWRDESEWPPRGSRLVPYYLHSAGGAAAATAGGALREDPPDAEFPDVYVYDPRDPVPTRGGGLCCYPNTLFSGAFDQRDVEARPDVLVFSTPPLATDVEVTGPVSVTLWAASTAPDTDFTAKLVDVDPSGYARNLTDGIIRARYRQGLARPSLVEPGTPYVYTIDLAGTSNLFRAGHQIRLEISSSNFPRFDRNPNTGHQFGAGSELRPATQTIYHDAARPSHVLLPIVERA
jgi:putative CocE/NonD family hydrolase